MAEIYELNINQGSNLSLEIALKNADGTPLNLTGYTARMQLRASYTAPEIIVELTTENGRIVITPLTGVVKLLLDATTTAALIAKTYVYDLETVSLVGFVTRVLQGEAIVSPEVTR
jgi:hypothetical protein